MNISRLEAREALQRVMETAIGSGRLEREDQRPILDEWREAAELTPRSMRQKMSKEQARVVLAGMGIGSKG